MPKGAIVSKPAKASTASPKPKRTTWWPARIPDNSRLELTATLKGNGAVHAEVLDDQNKVMGAWTTTALAQGVTVTLRSPRDYVAHVDAALLDGASTLKVTAQIVEDDGEVYDGPFEYETTGTAGKSANVTILMWTALS